MQPDLDTFLQSHTLPGKVIFGKVWGSWSHNTQTPVSDLDYLVVYQAPTARLLSLHPPPETVDGQKPDFQAHEALKFCQLLLKGNPAIVEMLFTDRLCMKTAPWTELESRRERFLSRTVVRQYLGYAEGQLKRLVSHGPLHTAGGAYNEKWAYHLLRLLDDAERIARGEAPVVWKEGPERDFLMKVRTGEFPKERVERMALDRMAAVNALQPWPLLETGDEAVLERWLLDLRGV